MTTPPVSKIMKFFGGPKDRETLKYCGTEPPWRKRFHMETGCHRYQLEDMVDERDPGLHTRIYLYKYTGMDQKGARS